MVFPASVNTQINGQAVLDTLGPVLQTGLHFHAGKLVKIHGEYPSNGVTTLTECSVLWKTAGNREWQNAYRFPSAGFSVLHAQLGNQDILGQAIAVIPMMRFEKWKDKNCFSWKTGLGIAWFNKPYHNTDNPHNLVIGSSFANMSMLSVELSRPLTQLLRISIGISYTHASNAHIAVPNIGANIIAAHTGISLSARSLNKTLPPYASIAHITKWSFGIYGVLGFQEFIGTLRPADGIRYPVYGAGAMARFARNVKGVFSAGINYHYYPSYNEYIISQELFPAGTNSRSKAQTVVAFLGYEWTFGRIALFAQAGLNIYNPFMHAINNVWDLPKHGFLNIWTSNKLGYRYYILSDQHAVQPFMHIAVKTNGGTADFFETGFGVVFN